MTMTTIKVSRETRDLLKEQAAAQHIPMDSYLRKLAEDAEREARWARLGEAIANTSAEDMESWRQEAREWDRLAGDGLENLNDDYA